jgi:hypothetical protein
MEQQMKNILSRGLTLLPFFVLAIFLAALALSGSTSTYKTTPKYEAKALSYSRKLYTENTTEYVQAAALGSWGLITSGSSATVSVRVLDSSGAFLTRATITVTPTATAISALTWDTGWSSTYAYAQVVSMVGTVYTSQSAATLTTSTGDIVTPGYMLGASTGVAQSGAATSSNQVAANTSLSSIVTNTGRSPNISALGTVTAQSASVNTALTPGTTSNARGIWVANTGTNDAWIGLTSGGDQLWIVPAGTDRQIPYTGSVYFNPATTGQTINISSAQYAN